MKISIFKHKICLIANVYKLVIRFIHMIEIRTKLRRWGNSFGIVIPISVVESGEAREGEEIRALIIGRKKVNLKKLFGKHKFSKSTKQLMHEMNEELYND